MDGADSDRCGCHSGNAMRRCQRDAEDRDDLRDHLDRLYRSARHMEFAPPVTSEALHREVLQIAREQGIQEDMYVRITFYLGGDGSWHSENDIHYLVSCRSMRSELGSRPPAKVGVTRFRRIDSDAMPAYVKAGANYLNSRYAMLDVRARGFDDALFLTAEGVVAEATGSTLFFFKDGAIHTPSLDCDILPGITRNRIIQLCAANGIEVHERKILPEELQSFEGAVLAGTMVELRPISVLDSHQLNTRTPLHGKLVELLSDYAYQPHPSKSSVAYP